MAYQVGLLCLVPFLDAFLFQVLVETQLLRKLYDLVFGDRPMDLGFGVKLERFRVRTYPGSERPRAFESHLTIVDASTGGSQSRLVSMNHPTSYGGYTFYQSSYGTDAGEAVTFLNVAWDVGQPITFTGYITLMVGMLVVLATRGRAWRRSAAGLAEHDSSVAELRVADGLK